jgi:hypothetical protein
VTFNDATGRLQLDAPGSFTGIISGTGTSSGSDTLTLIGVGGATASAAIVGNTLTVDDVINAGTTHTLSYTVGGNFVNGHASASTTGVGGTTTVLLACFTAGTRLLTTAGEVAVESLRVGALMPTASGRRLAPVRWIGRTSIDLDLHLAPEWAAPIRVRANAFAAGVPHRDLLLSPDHAIAVDGALIPVYLLVNGSTIQREPARGAVRYFHVELDAHDMLLAEGLAAESYLDTGNRTAFVNSYGAPVLRSALRAIPGTKRALGAWGAY